MARSAPFFVGGVTPLSNLSHSDRPEYVYNYYVTYMDEANIWHYALPPLLSLFCSPRNCPVAMDGVSELAELNI